jgi:excisionase family DNA binding protein
VTPADLDLAAALRAILRHPLVREEIRSIVQETTPPAPSVGDTLLTTEEVAARLGVRPDAVREHIAGGRLDALRPPGLKGYRVKRSALEAFLAGSAAAPQFNLDDERERRARALIAPKGK